MEISELFNLQFVILCLVVTAITHVIKAILSPIKTNKIVKTVIVPSLAICIGGIVGYFIATIINGLIAGLLSSLVYAKVRDFIKAS